MVADLLLVVPVSAGLAFEDLELLVHAEQIFAAVFRVRRQRSTLASVRTLPDWSRSLNPSEPFRRSVTRTVVVTAGAKDKNKALSKNSFFAYNCALSFDISHPIGAGEVVFLWTTWTLPLLYNFLAFCV